MSLQSGQTGAAVTTLQTNLNVLGYGLVVTGIYDTATFNAVESFQEQYFRGTGFPATGIYDSVTDTMLQRVLQAEYSAPATPSTTPTLADYPGGPVVYALLYSVLNSVGGGFLITSSTTGTNFILALTGSSNATELLPATTYTPALIFPNGSAGQAIIRNMTSGYSPCPLVYTGPDNSAALTALTPGTAIAPITYSIDSTGHVTLLNTTTGNFLPVLVTGPDISPATTT